MFQLFILVLALIMSAILTLLLTTTTGFAGLLLKSWVDDIFAKNLFGIEPLDLDAMMSLLAQINGVWVCLISACISMWFVGFVLRAFPALSEWVGVIPCSLFVLGGDACSVWSTIVSLGRSAQSQFHLGALLAIHMLSLLSIYFGVGLNFRDLFRKVGA